MGVAGEEIAVGPGGLAEDEPPELEIGHPGHQLHVLEQVGEVVDQEGVGLLRGGVDRLDHGAVAAGLLAVAEKKLGVLARLEEDGAVLHRRALAAYGDAGLGMASLLSRGVVLSMENRSVFFKANENLKAVLGNGEEPCGYRTMIQAVDAAEQRPKSTFPRPGRLSAAAWRIILGLLSNRPRPRHIGGATTGTTRWNLYLRLQGHGLNPGGAAGWETTILAFYGSALGLDKADTDRRKQLLVASASSPMRGRDFQQGAGPAVSLSSSPAADFSTRSEILLSTKNGRPILHLQRRRRQDQLCNQLGILTRVLIFFNAVIAQVRDDQTSARLHPLRK